MGGVYGRGVSRLNRSRRHDEPDYDYGDGRRLQQRYEYGVNSKAALAECHPSFMPTPAEFKLFLEKVPGLISMIISMIILIIISMIPARGPQTVLQRGVT